MKVTTINSVPAFPLESHPRLGDRDAAAQPHRPWEPRLRFQRQSALPGVENRGAHQGKPRPIFPMAGDSLYRRGLQSVTVPTLLSVACDVVVMTPDRVTVNAVALCHP